MRSKDHTSLKSEGRRQRAGPRLRSISRRSRGGDRRHICSPATRRGASPQHRHVAGVAAEATGLYRPHFRPPQVLITSDPGDKDLVSFDWLMGKLRRHGLAIYSKSQGSSW